MCHITSFLLQYVAMCSKCPLQHERKRVDADTTRHSHSITVWLGVAHSLLMCHFSSSTSEILIR